MDAFIITLPNGIYDIVDRVMRPLVLKQTRRPRSDHGKARQSVSSSSSHHHGASSHQHDDDDDVKTSRAIARSWGSFTNNVNVASTNEVNAVKTSIELPIDPDMPELEDIVYSDHDEDVGAEADMNNLDAFMPVSPIPTTRVHKDHPVE
ncbi:hypothetical protein Tco_1163034 [Tanacetum coccineum]